MDAPESARGIAGVPGFSMCPVLGFGTGEDCPVACALTLRVPSVDVDAEKDEVMRRLEPWISAAARAWAPGRRLVTAEQTHGRAVAVIREIPAGPVPVVDALVTARRDVVLGIAVADCCPVWLWAPAGRGLAVVHAGRKGAEAGVVVEAAEELAALAGVATGELGAFLGPCIRPPHYEVDIPAILKAQLAALGLERVGDCGLDTASDRERFYSYRMEKGRTGRMMAMGWLRD